MNYLFLKETSIVSQRFIITFTENHSSPYHSKNRVCHGDVLGSTEVTVQSHLQDNITHYTDQSTDSTDNQLLESSEFYSQHSPVYREQIMIDMTLYIAKLSGQTFNCKT